MFGNFFSDIVSSASSVRLTKVLSAFKLTEQTTEAQLGVDAQNPIDVASIVVSGMVVVFVALIILILLVMIYGKIFDSIIEKKKNAQSKSETEISVAEQTKTITPELSEATTDSDNEIVAAISAVIAQISSEEGVQYRIKSVTPVQKGSRRNAWNLEGLRQNTSPF